VQRCEAASIANGNRFAVTGGAHGNAYRCAERNAVGNSTIITNTITIADIYGAHADTIAAVRLQVNGP
jgi:hypothetical protein